MQSTRHFVQCIDGIGQRSKVRSQVRSLRHDRAEHLECAQVVFTIVGIGAGNDVFIQGKYCTKGVKA